MGMYDTLGTEDGQVKCFTAVCYYNPKYINHNDPSVNIGYIGGLLRYFGKDETVPVKTWWYQYPDNFLIIDIDPYTPSESIVHKITNRKFEASSYMNALPDNLFDGIAVVIDKYGKTLPIDSLSSLLEYYDDYIQLQTQADAIMKQYHVDFKEAKTDIQKFLLSMNERDAKIDALTEPFRRKWPSDTNNGILEDFGAYLDAIYRAINRDESYRQHENYYLNLISEFAWYITKHHLTLDAFLSWYNDDANKDTIVDTYNRFTDDCKAIHITL